MRGLSTHFRTRSVGQPVQVASGRELRVLLAPKLSLAPGRQQDALLTLLAWVTDGVRELILAIPHEERAGQLALDIQAAFRAIEAATLAYPSNFRPLPPAFPKLWKEEAERWIALMVPSDSRGNPGRVQRNALLMLCSFYRLAFGQDPSINPPTLIFVEAWFAEFGPEMEKATKEARPTDERKYRFKEWKPTRDALRKALPPYLNDVLVTKQVKSWYCEIMLFRKIRETTLTNCRE
jgi:hypothetical protein